MTHITTLGPMDVKYLTSEYSTADGICIRNLPDHQINLITGMQEYLFALSELQGSHFEMDKACDRIANKIL
jgi:hypothetical protein